MRLRRRSAGRAPEPGRAAPRCGPAAAPRQGSCARRDDRRVHVGQVAKSHFLLGGVDVEIHETRIDLDEDERGRVPAAGHIPLVGVLGSLQQGELPHPPPVDESLEEPAIPASQLGQPAHDARREPAAFDLCLPQEARIQELPVGRGDPVELRRGRERQAELAIEEQPEGDGGVRDRPVDEHRTAQAGLALGRAQELPARRVIEEQLGDVDASSPACRGTARGRQGRPRARPGAAPRRRRLPRACSRSPACSPWPCSKAPRPGNRGSSPAAGRPRSRSSRWRAPSSTGQGPPPPCRPRHPRPGPGRYPPPRGTRRSPRLPRRSRCPGAPAQWKAAGR